MINFIFRYIALNPDAEKKEEEYESWEQRELRQIFVGQSQVWLWCIMGMITSVGQKLLMMSE